MDSGQNNTSQESPPVARTQREITGYALKSTPLNPFEQKALDVRNRGDPLCPGTDTTILLRLDCHLAGDHHSRLECLLLLLSRVRFRLPFVGGGRRHEDPSERDALGVGKEPHDQYLDPGNKGGGG